MNKTFKTICLFLALGTSSAFADNLNKCSFYSETFNKIDFNKLSPEDETNFSEILSSLKYKGYSLTNDKSKASFSLVFDEKSKTTSKYLGLSNDTTYAEMAKTLHLPIEDVYSALRRIEEHEFIKTIRAGQYFVRRYFTKVNDEDLGQTYNDFEI